MTPHPFSALFTNQQLFAKPPTIRFTRTFSTTMHICMTGLKVGSPSCCPEQCWLQCRFKVATPLSANFSSTFCLSHTLPFPILLSLLSVSLSLSSCALPHLSRPHMHTLLFYHFIHVPTYHSRTCPSVLTWSSCNAYASMAVTHRVSVCPYAAQERVHQLKPFFCFCL